jgi:hypothetical protein
MRAIVAVAFAIACGHAPPPPRPAPVELPVTGPRDLAGSWVTLDAADWHYTLSIDESGAIDQVIDRRKLGRCEQKGKLAATGQPKQYQLTYDKNECNRDYTGATLQLNVEWFTGYALVLVITGWGGEERHAYARAYAR